MISLKTNKQERLAFGKQKHARCLPGCAVSTDDSAGQTADTSAAVKHRFAGKKAARVAILTLFILLFIPLLTASAEGALDINMNGDNVDTVEILLMLTVIGLLPSILMLTTCFTRVIITLSFVRNALGLQQTPPNQVLVGIALFLSLFIMAPVINEINETAYTPYKNEEITQDEFFQKATVPMKRFMLKQTKNEDLNLFVDLAKIDKADKPEDLSLTVIIPAFITSELKRAFTIGFLLYIPFLVIDMIVSSTLMSMGMIMLPPVTIAMPFKLLLFVLVDGWGLLFRSLVSSFNF